MRIITADEVIAMKPCDDYSHDQIRKNHGPDGITVDQLIAMEVPRGDVFWVLVRLLDAKQSRLAAADIAETVLHIFESEYPDDDRPRKAIEMARIGTPYAASAAYGARADATATSHRAAYTSTDAASASYAAYAADAATDATDAAYAASAAYGAAYAADAARAASYAAAYAAYASYAAASAARAAQVNKNIEIVRGYLG